MATASFDHAPSRALRQHPFGAHGVLLAVPLSVVLWTLILMPFI